ncbi:centromeric protein E [Enteropsectra breve]|nr:centromeric protein E [Enteropsectra breve]
MGKQIQVYIRHRPSEEKPFWSKEQNALTYTKNSQMCSYNCFESLFFTENNAEIYDLKIGSAIKNFKVEQNLTIFAYGQTGSGKTYTMIGDSENGIIHLALKDLLPGEITLSFFEIYNDRVYDLWSTEELSIYCKGTETLINNLVAVPVKTLEQAYDFLRACETNRSTSMTEYNMQSSRSHTIFQIRIGKKILTFIDLAGSEKASANEERQKEGSYINRSLLSLGKVINCISIGGFVNYRESKLTRILQPSFVNNASLIAFCMISPHEEYLEESISTLKFAARLANLELRMKKIKLKEENTEKKVVQRPCKQKTMPARKNMQNFNILFDKRRISEASQSAKDLPSMETSLDESPAEQLSPKGIAFENIKPYSGIKHCDNEKIVELLTTEEVAMHSGHSYFSSDEMGTATFRDILGMYEKRISSLESMIAELLDKFPSRLQNEIFVLEKEMFDMKKQMIYDILAKEETQNTHT